MRQGNYNANNPPTIIRQKNENFFRDELEIEFEVDVFVTPKGFREIQYITEKEMPKKDAVKKNGDVVQNKIPFHE